MSAVTVPERHVALYSILVEGTEVTEQLARRIHEVRVVSYLRLPDMCAFTASFPKGTEGQGEPIDEHPFEIGRQLEIKLGAREELTTTTLFSGDIVSLDADFRPGGVDLLVRGFDHSHSLLRSRNAKTFQNQTSSDIVERILRDAGFECETDPSGEPHTFVQQDNETDWGFIWRLAERVGFEFVVEDGIARFRRQQPDGSPVALAWPTTLRSFRPRVTAVQQVDEVTLSAQDPRTKQSIDVTASSPQQIAQIGVERDSVRKAFEGAHVHVATEPVESHAEGQALAQSLLDKLANGYLAAEGVCDGDPSVRPGATLQLSGLGEQFSGTYRVATATHVLRGGSAYETQFTTSDAGTLLGAVGPSTATSGVAPFGAQLVLGLVTNNKDPDGLGRVRVSYPSLGGDVEGAWARIATPSAGEARGLLMLPIVGDEVLIGFEHDDTTRPYVLGSLFNGVDKPGDELAQQEDGSFAVLSDNRIHLSSKDTMSLRSGGALTIDVDGDVAVSGAKKLSVSAGTEITIEAQTTLTLKCGPSQIQLSSAGVTVSGPMINLG
jgi:uncharacterized protein involved in type VI secretion and phage assembly